MNARLPIVLALVLAAAACGPKVAQRERRSPGARLRLPALDPRRRRRGVHELPRRSRRRRSSRRACATCRSRRTPRSRRRARTATTRTRSRSSRRGRAPFRLHLLARRPPAARGRRLQALPPRCLPSRATPRRRRRRWRPAPRATPTSRTSPQARCMPCHVDLQGLQARDRVQARGRLAPRPRRARAAERRELRAVPRPDLLRRVPLAADRRRPAVDHLPGAGGPRVHPPRRLRLAPHDRGRREPGELPPLPRLAVLRGLPRRSRGSRSSAGRPFRDPHPAGWATPHRRARSRSTRDAARRDISSCAGCHDQGAAATCVGCHRARSSGFPGVATTVEGPNGPHPSSFVSKHRGENKNEGICAACH